MLGQRNTADRNSGTRRLFRERGQVPQKALDVSVLDILKLYIVVRSQRRAQDVDLGDKFNTITPCATTPLAISLSLRSISV
jgi:hypothetical protein